MPAVANPEAELAPRKGDEILAPDELQTISLFSNLKKIPSFDKFPGSVVLRHYRPGEAIVRQGDGGWTAFYILTADDLVKLRELRLANLRQAREQAETDAAYKRRRLVEQIAALEEQLEDLSAWASMPAEERRQQPVVTAHIDVELSSKRGRPSLLGRLFGQRQAAPRARPRFIPNDGSVDISLATRQAPMFEGELFGEMTCLNNVPRSATVIANRDWYVLEMLRNILDQLRRDKGFKENSDRIYRERALGPQLRRFSIFADLPEAELDTLRTHAKLMTYSSGETIHNEGDPSDAFYVIRNGMVKVTKKLPTPRTLTYLGRGDFFGEAGILLDQPRSATCVAIGHPQAADGGSDVELVVIDRPAFLEVCQSSSALQSLFREQQRIYGARERQWREGGTAGQQQAEALSPQFEELGLIQGQKLMLVDLDRCTRCGDCMQACIDTHPDGVSRLYLDGPRIGKYLVPNACRKCLDPVCMIGCPVGSIVRGERGEIVIQDWCIGCGLCADQCPYGSIHMHHLDTLNFERERSRKPSGTAGETHEKEVDQRAVVCDLCSGLNGMGPACVYHCPHDAAIRIDARWEFPTA